MKGQFGQGDLLAGGVSVAVLIVVLWAGIPWWLGIVLALFAYAGAVLIRPQIEALQEAPIDHDQIGYDVAVEHLASIRTLEPRIADTTIRDQVGRIVNTVDKTLAAMVEDRNLAAAPLLADNLLAPFDDLLTDYVRLTNRGVKSAGEAIHRAETHDFPMIEQAAEMFYEKLHRSHVVDLAALGEVLEFNVESMNSTRLRRSPR